MLKKIIYISSFLTLFLFYSLCSLTYANKQALNDQLQSILHQAVDNSDTTPGAVLLVSSPKLSTIIVAAGYADKKSKTAMRIDNNFRIASISKTFLAVTVMKLAAAGQFSLDDKIADLLPSSIDIARIPNGQIVTVRQLLRMRSGIPNYLEYDTYTEKMNSEPNHRWIPEDGIEMIYDEKPSFAPDRSYEYSNTNYLLLQRIVENTTDKSYATQIRKYILDPLHLKNTYVEVHEQRAGGFNGLITHGYALESKQLEDVTTFNDGFGVGDGGMITTAQDLATFVQALLQYKTLLSPKLLNEMMDVKGPEKYGLGIYQEQVGDEWAWTHNGTSSGFATQFYYFPDRKLTIIILTNSADSDIINDVTDQTLNLIANQ